MHNKYVTIFLWIIFGFVVVVAGVVTYIALAFDPNQYKPQIVQAVKDKTNRTLKLDGDIKLTIFPSLGASLGKASLSEPASDKIFASFDDVHVAVKLLPLLHKQVVVDGVDVTDLQAEVTRYRSGKTSIDDLLGGAASQAQQPAPEQKAETPASPVSIDIAHVAIKNAGFSYTDEAAGAHYAISKLNLTTGRVAPGVQFPVDLNVHVESDKPKTALDIVLGAKATFDLEKQAYSVADLNFSAKGLAAGIDNIDASVKGDNVDAQLATMQLAVSNLAIQASGKQAGADFNVNASVPALQVTPDKVSGDKIALDALLNAAGSKIVAKLDVPSVSGNTKSFTVPELNASVDVTQQALSAQAKLTTNLTGSIENQHFELPKLTLTANVNDPSLPKNPINITLNGSALADVPKEIATLTFDTKLDDSTITGKVGATKFSPMTYAFDINIDKLDADQYLPNAEPSKTPAPAETSDPNQKIDLSALKTLYANGSLKVGSLKIQNMKATNIRVGLKAAGGKVDVNPLAADLYQGTLNGAVTVDATTATPAFAARETLSGVNIEPLIKDKANIDLISGKGNVALDVATRGDTVPALEKALNGKASFSLTNGAIKGFDIAGTIRSVKNIFKAGGQQTQEGAVDTTKETDFSELSGSFNIQNGVAHNDDLLGKSPLLRLNGNGDIDIGNAMLDYTLKATVVATTSGQGGKDLADLNGVTVPVHLTGAFAAPKYKIDFGSIAASAAKSEVKNQVKNKVDDALKNGLKGGLKGLLK